MIYFFGSFYEMIHHILIETGNTDSIPGPYFRSLLEEFDNLKRFIGCLFSESFSLWLKSLKVSAKLLPCAFSLKVDSAQ